VGSDATGRSVLLCELEGWAAWLEQRRPELAAEEVDALLAWRVRLDAAGPARLAPEGFDFYLVETRRSLARARRGRSGPCRPRPPPPLQSRPRPRR
jgi:hypothetical protein